MDTIARQVCLNAGEDAFMQGEDLGAILKIARNYFQPDALSHAYRQVAKFHKRRRADHATERCLPGFDVLRRKAEARVEMEGAFPDGFVSILRMQDSAPPRAEK